MTSYASFCPVAKTAEVFAERWTPLVLRELLMGARRFTDLRRGLPLISRASLSHRLRALELAGIVEKTGPRGEYRLTAAGEGFRPLIEMMAAWGQSHGRGRVIPEDTDPEQLLWGMRRHLETRHAPAERLVVQFEFRGLPASWRGARYLWLMLRQTEIDVCQKNPGYDIDVVIAADVTALTLVWLGHRGLAEACRAGEVAISGPPRAVAKTRAVLGLRDEAWLRPFDLSVRPDPFGPPLHVADGP